MKKTILFLFLSLVMVGCKPSNDDPNPSQPGTAATANPVNCIDLTDYHTKVTQEEKAEWLRKNGENVCESVLFHEIEGTHLISNPEEIEETVGTTGLKMKWGEIKNFIGTSVYNAYISFDIDPNRNITGIKMIPKFDPKTTCYSLPLFRSIAAKNTLKDTDLFEFKDARVGTVQTVVIKVSNSITAAYYDYSDEPGTIPFRSAL
ncbi:hypothetical protein [Flavobacterium sp.]|uniref:hypothetical protein n=1 Tax=Flavobacterium sp. TaxID=239 RepID=UPI003D6C4D0E